MSEKPTLPDLGKLAAVIEDHVNWHDHILSAFLYPEQIDISDFTLSIPISYEQWTQSNPLVDIKRMELINKTHEEMISNFLRMGKTHINFSKPSYDDYFLFHSAYSNFMMLILNLLKKDSSISGGIGGSHRLKPSEQIKSDLEEEMERTARHGNPFSLAMVRIDGFVEDSQMHYKLNFIEQSILDCVRPFDDVYYIDNGLFLITFKHTDMSGSDIAITRLQRLIELNNTGEPITVSCGIAEPGEGEDFVQLLKSMEQDLNTHNKDKGVVLKVMDVSPLQRFLQQNK